MLNRHISQDRPISSSAFSILESKSRTPLVPYHSRVVVFVFNYLSDFCKGNVPGFLWILQSCLFQRGTLLKVVPLACLFLLAELKDPRDNQTWKPPLFRVFPPATQYHTEATLLFTKLNPKTVVQCRVLVSIPIPARCPVIPWGTPENKRVQPLTRSLVPEPKLCMEVRPTISSW